MKTGSLKIGDFVPIFSLPDQDGNMFDMGTLVGKKKLVIFFYPKDGSLFCTREACFFRDFNDAFTEADAVLIGISSQSTESHKKFAADYNLKYKILSDTGNKVRELFGVPSNLFGMIPGRVTYVADRTGRIVSVFNSQTDVERHVDEALKICLLLKKAE
ncbi:MAG: peroxiredoxin [Methanosarcina sp.]|nr:peroxiredoxin [Methanosarcina sp.]